MSKKKASVRAHTKEKLQVYRECLTNCLSVLTRRKGFNKITVCEPFAGSGLVGGQLPGSASHAAHVINGFLTEGDSRCKIELLLNELNANKCRKLREKLSKYSSFVSVTNIDADVFINSILATKNVQMGMFFIDPFGYTQVKQKTLDRLFEFQVDIIIFVPTNQIYRFVNAGRTAGKLGPVRKFLEDCGIIKRDFASVKKLEKALVRNFKRRANTIFGYKHPLINREKKHSRHCLFFITKHVVGARKFLDGIEKAKEMQPGFQHLIPGINADKHRKTVLSCLKKEVDNYELYKLLIAKRLLPKKANPILKQLENDGVISVAEVYSGSRKSKGFYLGDAKKKVRIKKN